VKVVSSRLVADALIKCGFQEHQIHPRDSEVALLTKRGVELLGKRFASFLWTTGLDKYADERWDCDDYASACRVFAAIDHAKWSKVDAGVAFGEVWFIGDEGGHAINFATHENEKGELEICLYEPQVQWNSQGTAVVSLSEVPISSVQRWLFASW